MESFDAMESYLLAMDSFSSGDELYRPWNHWGFTGSSCSLPPLLGYDDDDDSLLLMDHHQYFSRESLFQDDVDFEAMSWEMESSGSSKEGRAGGAAEAGACGGKAEAEAKEKVEVETEAEARDGDCGGRKQGGGRVVVKGRGEVERVLTFEEVSRYFYMPITKAAKELNVGLTLLKKKCRELGIPRWPHRKMRSLQTLIQNVQSIGRKEERRRAVAILEEERRMMEKMPAIQMEENTKRLRQACFKANYKRRRLMAGLVGGDVRGRVEIGGGLIQEPLGLSWEEHV